MTLFPLWQIDYTGTLPYWRRQCFVCLLGGIDSFSGCGFAFSGRKYLCQEDHAGVRLQNVLSNTLVIHPALLLWIHFSAKELRQWDYAHGIHWSYYTMLKQLD